MAVVTTVGTTSTASVDPIPEIAKICREEKMWLHIDGAYGGAFAMLPEYEWVRNGWEMADSIVINPHKTLFVPLDFSVLYVRDLERLRRVFTLVPEVLARRHRRRREELHGLRDPAGPKIPRAQSVGDLALVRPRRNRFAPARTNPPGKLAGGLDQDRQSIRARRASQHGRGLFSFRWTRRPRRAGARGARARRLQRKHRQFEQRDSWSKSMLQAALTSHKPNCAAEQSCALASVTCSRRKNTCTRRGRSSEKQPKS